MKVEKVNTFNDAIDSGVNNEYPTSKYLFTQPYLHMIVGQRTAGKSHLASKILSQYQKEKTFDRVYIVTPSFNSNKAYFGKYINEEDIYEPTRDSIQQVIESVEADRDHYEDYLRQKKMYEQYRKDAKRSIKSIDEDNLIHYYENGYFDGMKPEYKYNNKEQPPRSLLILDDCLGSPAILQSSGLTRIATLNRHIAAMEEDHNGRSACGLAVCILSQSYRMNNGISRVLRENLSLLTLFANKQQKQLDAIKEELANVVDINLFDKAYEYATKEKYGNLTIDFKSKCPSMTFRKNLNEFIKFDELGCTCDKKST